MRQSSAKLEDLLAPSHETSDEETAIAALTALRNNNHHLHQYHQQNLINTINKNSNSSDSHDPSLNASGKSVTSLISKIHLQNLEANSVSVIPLDAKSSASPPQIHVKNLTQLQQHLETAAVLMDIGKKVIISPPSSNPQSPSSLEHHQHHNNNHMNSNKNSKKSISTSVIKVNNRQIQSRRMPSNALCLSLQAQDYSIGHMKRTPSSEEMDLSIKRMKKMGGNTICTPVPTLSNMIPLIKKEVIKKEMNENDDRMSPHSDSNDSDSDSGRLQMDISSQEDADEIKSLSNMNKIGRDTPESLISEEHAFDGTDAATTQLWQALAQHTTSKIYISSRKIKYY